jgi:hypothetical protein
VNSPSVIRAPTSTWERLLIGRGTSRGVRSSCPCSRPFANRSIC